MGFSLSKLFGKTELEKESKDSVEEIVNAVEQTPFAISKNNVLYAGFNELGGYFFLQTIVIGSLKVKSKNGAQLFINGDAIKMSLDADSMEFESNASNVKGRHVTSIDFQIEETDIKYIQSAKIDTVKLIVKNQQIVFDKYDV